MNLLRSIFNLFRRPTQNERMAKATGNDFHTGRRAS